MGKFLYHEQCPKCAENGHDRDGNNLGRYDDGGAYCFRCGWFDLGPSGGVSDRVQRGADDDAALDWTPLKGEYEPLQHRGISEEICRLYGYAQAEVKGVAVEIANYRDTEGRLAAQKIRGPHKQFVCRGDMRRASLFGEHMWRRGGKRLVITEGEVDCLAVAQVLGGRWPVVSIQNGASGAVASIKRSFDFVNSYESVLLSFDMDDAGQKVAIAVAELLSPGKAKLVQLPRKDAAEMLEHGESRGLVTALWEAREYTPPGIMSVAEVLDKPRPRRRVYPYPWPTMNKRLFGMAEGSIIMIASGTGMGKSTLARTLAHHHLRNGNRVGMLMLEESPIETIHEMMSFESGIPVNKIMTARMLNEQLVQQGEDPMEFDVADDLSDDVYNRLRDDLRAKNQLFIYDSDGRSEDILSRIEFMVQALGCKIIILDHISLVVAAMGGTNERTEIDRLLARLRGLVDRTGVLLVVVCQLRKSAGEEYEEGGRVTLQDLRGSGMLSMVPNAVLACERDQQHPDESQRNTMLIRSLKHRLSGYTGPVINLRWNSSQHRYEETTMADTTELLKMEAIPNGT